MKRRKFLTIAGGGIVLAAGAGIGGFAMTREPSKALAAWKQAGSLYEEPRRRALSYAILAPNPHNRQPWMVDLSKNDAITLFVDTDRLLPHTDPFSRQITIGQGCFLELLRMAAAEDGYRADIDPFPGGSDTLALDQRPIAEITFAKDSSVKPDPLFRHVMARRSLKEPFDLNRKVSNASLQTIMASVPGELETGTTNDQQKVENLRRLTHEALAVEIETPHTYKESVDLFRIGKREVEANPDGIDFSGLLFDTLAATGQFTRELALDKNSSAYQQGLAAVFANTDTAMAYVWSISKANTRTDQINAGRDWLRINLAATGLGLGLQPLSQALQEYPEMESHYKEIHQTLAPDGGTIQMLGRLGYGKSVPESPRWPLEAKIMKA